MNCNAYGSYSVRETFSPLAPFSSLSENESADSVYSGLRFPFIAQHDNLPGHNAIDGGNRPYSPIPDSSHPWEETQQRSSYDPIFVETTPETQQQPYDSTLAKTRAGSKDGGSSRHRCNECNQSFADKNGLNRHAKTIPYISRRNGLVLLRVVANLVKQSLGRMISGGTARRDTLR